MGDACEGEFEDDEADDEAEVCDLDTYNGCGPDLGPESLKNGGIGFVDGNLAFYAECCTSWKNIDKFTASNIKCVVTYDATRVNFKELALMCNPPTAAVLRRFEQLIAWLNARREQLTNDIAAAECEARDLWSVALSDLGPDGPKWRALDGPENPRVTAMREELDGLDSPSQEYLDTVLDELDRLEQP